MPLDPLSPFSPGDPGPLPATTWNRLVEMLRRDPNGRLGRAGGGFLPDRLGPTLTALVRNDTGSAASHGYALAITGALLDPTASPPDWLNRPVFSGDVPAAASDQPAVLLEPVADGAIGRAAVGGLVYAQVNLTSLAHTWANLIPSDATKFVSGASGHARILWHESGSTGTQAAVLLLGDGDGEEAAFTGVARTFTGSNPGRTSITGGGGYTRVDAGNATAYEVGATFVSGASIVIPTSGYYLLQMQAFLSTSHTVVVATSPPIGVSIHLGNYDGAGPTAIYCEDYGVIPPGSVQGDFNVSATHYIAATTIIYPYLSTDDTSGGAFNVDLGSFRLEVTKVG